MAITLDFQRESLTIYATKPPDKSPDILLPSEDAMQNILSAMKQSGETTGSMKAAEILMDADQIDPYAACTPAHKQSQSNSSSRSCR